MRGGRAAGAKGRRREVELVNLHREAGCHAERVPLSGAAGGSFSGDVIVHAFGPGEPPLRAEVKARAAGSGFTVLERWLGDHHALFLRRDRAEPMVVLPWSTWTKLLGRVKP